jgi:bifunctional non-homologous end joining protein LigD
MSDEERDGVSLTNLDQPLFSGAAATKRDLVDYLDAVAEKIIGELRDRPLSVIRVRPGQAPFMQKNVPKYTPDWVRTVPLWAEAARREVSYALCNDRRTLLSADSKTGQAAWLCPSGAPLRWFGSCSRGIGGEG